MNNTVSIRAKRETINRQPRQPTTKTHNDRVVVKKEDQLTRFSTSLKSISTRNRNRSNATQCPVLWNIISTFFTAKQSTTGSSITRKQRSIYLVCPLGVS